MERKLERRADEEITHKNMIGMICDVHFGDTRYDLTPAIPKWLPNNHPEAFSEAATTPNPHPHLANTHLLYPLQTSSTQQSPPLQRFLHIRPQHIPFPHLPPHAPPNTQKECPPPSFHQVKVKASPLFLPFLFKCIRPEPSLHKARRSQEALLGSRL